MKRKTDIVTFKVDEALLEAMQGLSNRSHFIRSAILAALDNVCPLCKGSGLLSPKQQEHWSTFSESHTVEECQDCNELHLVCNNRTER